MIYKAPKSRKESGRIKESGRMCYNDSDVIKPYF